MRQFFTDLEEECETIETETTETNHIAPTSVWSLGQLGPSLDHGQLCPKRLTNDAYRTLFQLKEYHLLEDIYLYVETELLQHAEVNNSMLLRNISSSTTQEAGAKQRKRKSDILCFIKLYISRSEGYKLLGGVSLPANSELKSLVEEGRNLANKHFNKEMKLMFETRDCKKHFYEHNIPEISLSSGTILKIKLYGDKKNNFLNKFSILERRSKSSSRQSRSKTNTCTSKKESIEKEKPFTLGELIIAREINEI